jgi:hypothetical protein
MPVKTGDFSIAPYLYAVFSCVLSVTNTRNQAKEPASESGRAGSPLRDVSTFSRRSDISRFRRSDCFPLEWGLSGKAKKRASHGAGEKQVPRRIAKGAMLARDDTKTKWGRDTAARRGALWD